MKWTRFEWAKFETGRGTWLERVLWRNSAPPCSTLTMVRNVKWDLKRRALFPYRVGWLYVIHSYRRAVYIVETWNTAISRIIRKWYSLYYRRVVRNYHATHIRVLFVTIRREVLNATGPVKCSGLCSAASGL